MNERIWDKFLTERDKTVFAASGYGARAGFGKRPALLVIDVNWAFCGERPQPILESIRAPRDFRSSTPQGRGVRTIGMPAAGGGRARVVMRQAEPPATIPTATRSSA